MHFSFMALAGAYALAVPSTRADRLIPLNVLDSIIQTSVTSEYLSWFEDFTYGPYATSAAFATFLESQWTSNRQQSDELAPYLVCNTTPDKSGYERIQLISSQCETTRIGENVVQNNIERTCFNAALTFGIADPCSRGENVTVVPYTSWMKVGGNTLFNGFWALENLLSQTDIAKVYDGNVPVADRFMFYTCESTPLQEMNRVKASAQEALEQTYNNTDECQSPTFTDIWNFSQESGNLQLHTIDQQSSTCGTDDDCYMAHIGCALALIESLASYPFVCNVEYDARVVVGGFGGGFGDGDTYNDDGIGGGIGFPGDNVITTVDEGFNIMPVVTDVTTLSNAPSIATITATTEAPTEAPVAKTEAPMAMIKPPIATIPATTEAPTKAPVARTEVPVAKTEAPVAKTEAPMAMIKPPVTATTLQPTLKGSVNNSSSTIKQQSDNSAAPRLDFKIISTVAALTLCLALY